MNANPSVGVHVHVVPFSLSNSMYEQYLEHNTFLLTQDATIHTIFNIPHRNYCVYTFIDKLNELLSGQIKVSYNVATNT